MGEMFAVPATPAEESDSGAGGEAASDMACRRTWSSLAYRCALLDRACTLLLLLRLLTWSTGARGVEGDGNDGGGEA